jgi:hypothetical protein
LEVLPDWLLHAKEDSVLDREEESAHRLACPFEMPAAHAFERAGSIDSASLKTQSPVRYMLGRTFLE